MEEVPPVVDGVGFGRDDESLGLELQVSLLGY